MLLYMIGIKTDILMVSESKLHHTFPIFQFAIDNFTEPSRLDFTRNGGGILLYVKIKMTTTLLTNYTLSEDMQALLVEIIIRKIKWPILCSHDSKLWWPIIYKK